MATITMNLSAKVNQNGQCEVYIKLQHASKLCLRAKTGIYVSPDHFEYDINRKLTTNPKKSIPAKAMTATAAEAIKNGWILTDKGHIVVRNRIDTPETLQAKESSEKIEKLCKKIEKAFNSADIDSIDKDWLKVTIDKILHPAKYISMEEKQKSMTFFDLMKEFKDTAKKKVDGKREGEKSDVWKRNFEVLIRALQRYEAWIRLYEKKKNFKLDIHTIDCNRLDDIESFLRNEYNLLEEFPDIYKQIPLSTDARRAAKNPEPRGRNTICSMLSRLKSFFAWLNEKKITSNNPFVGFEGTTSEKYGTPYYISLAERNLIAEYDLSSHPELAVQRDIFVFQCCVGCRVSDLMRLTQSNVVNDSIQYIPTKTKGESLRTVSVPLNERALSLLNKYRGVDKGGRLFPFISPQKYNDDIKRIFMLCGVTRNVTILNSVTGKEEQRPINELASSHMARRTFVGNLYQRIQDPNIIGSMSGHAEGSKAFSRYRVIDDETKKNAVKLIE